MRPLLRSILLARPSGSTTASRIPDLRQLHLNPRLLPCIRRQPQQPPQPPQHFRWFSSEGKAPGNGNGGDTPPPDSSAAPLGAPPPQPELKNLRLNMPRMFSAAMDDLQAAMFSAGQKLNEITGYSDIEALKKSIEKQEQCVKASRQAVRKGKEEYQAAINHRSASQREVNELLQRKHSWSPTDLERFTELYRSDHANELAETTAQDLLARAERVADEAQEGLARSILARYHEEQIWSDKIRRASTWGTWGLMGFNVLLFIVVQLGLEPWKRRRLVGGFEEKVRELIQEEGFRNPAEPAVDDRPWVDYIKEEVTGRVEELFGEEMVAVKRVDLTITVLESVALGAFITATLSLLWPGR
ncbi:hypothetical protein C7212DRAFT_292704, partial [Tuber magnatum]